MAKEFLDAIDKNGNIIGKFSREDIHRKGLLHCAVHVWLMNKRGELLIQKRAFNKESSPGLWDISVGGHVASGQTLKEASTREVKEELGIEIKTEDLVFIDRVRNFSYHQNKTYVNDELNDIFLVKTDNSINEFTLDPSEVSEVRYISPKNLKKEIANNSKNFCRHKEEYKILFKYLGVS